ncbi:MAG: hypothetical protein WB986_07585 [Methanoregula sp.]|uniref:hypothetical protein n=1 Tax=Methanoregula sp. TaxID=2052170 RepID=UPI003C44DF82
MVDIEKRWDENFGWLDKSLVGDMATFLDGINLHYKLPKKYLNNDVKGGGNLALPILICTTLELASSFYCGKAMGKDSYDATGNVIQFVTRYFPKSGYCREIPLIFWDGVRNGLTHRFYPNHYMFEGKQVGFTFYIEDGTVLSHIKKTQNGTIICINTPEFYMIVKEAISKYRIELETDKNLQNHFDDVFKFLNQPKNINKYSMKKKNKRSREKKNTDENSEEKNKKWVECDVLFERLEQNQPVNLFQ